jgi:hypothetical protein
MLLPQPIAYFRAPGQDTGIGTGDIQQNKIKPAVLFYMVPDLVVVHNGHTMDIQTTHVLSETFETLRMDVRGQDVGLVIGQFRQVCGLASRSGT